MMALCKQQSQTVEIILGKGSGSLSQNEDSRIHVLKVENRIPEATTTNKPALNSPKYVGRTPGNVAEDKTSAVIRCEVHTLWL